MKLNARQLRESVADPMIIKKLKKNPIYLVLDNVLDTYNIGSIFRLADAVAAEKAFLCGQTETPPNHRIKKASINTWQWVNWEYAEKTTEVIKSLRSEVTNLKVYAIEQHPKSLPIYNFKPEFPLALIVGNETYGVAPEVLSLSDAIIELPMFGINKSLNVMVCVGIALYRILEFLPKNEASKIHTKT